jgi:adenosine deaminase CECR1
MEEYLGKRRELISEDRAARLDSGRQQTTLSESADKLVRDIRAAEAVSVWSAESKEAVGDDNTHLFPGMAFLTGICTSEAVHKQQ